MKTKDEEECVRVTARVCLIVCALFASPYGELVAQETTTPKAATTDVKKPPELPGDQQTPGETQTQSPSQEQAVGRVALEEVAVTATRSAESLATIPAAVTVIDREQIEEQMQLSGNVGEILGKLVPGFSAPSQTPSHEAQTLRGRKVLVLIDGVPQNTTRDTMRNLTTIHPSAIERIEVIPGATAIYGESAAGGVINLITRAAGEGPLSFSTDVGSNTTLSHPGGSFGGYVRQTASGRRGVFDYSMSGAFEHVGGFFDARGDRIPPDPHGQGGLADTRTYNLFGKFGVTLGQQRLQFALNYFDAEQDTDYATDPAVNAFPPRTKRARARKGLQLEENQGTENLMVSLDYQHPHLFGSRLHAQVYYRDYLTRFGPFNGRTSALLRNIIQSRLESERFGLRLEIETPLPQFSLLTPTVLWGLDYSDEDTSQPVGIFDGATFDASRGLVFKKVDDRLWVPPIQPRDLGLFVQLETKITERLTLRTGFRHARAWVEVPDFTTLIGNAVKGGALDYEDTLFNAGAVLTLTESLNVFANFSQGFSLVDIGLVLRGSPAGASVRTLPLGAQKVDNYEVGVRTRWRALQLGVTGFYNESDLGTTSGGFGQPVIRAPERVYGFDSTVDLFLGDEWRVGGTASWIEGENDVNRNGVYKALSGFRIPPLKLTGHVEYVVLPRWRVRLQALYSGERTRAVDDLGPTVFGGRPVRNYATVDLISSFQIGPGMLHCGVENLLNEQYFLPVSQLLRSGRNDSYAAARGAMFNVGYSVTY